MVDQRKVISILGSTGVIGQKAFDIALANPEAFEIKVLIAKSNFELLARQAVAAGAKVVAIFDQSFYQPLKDLLAHHKVEVLSGPGGCEAAATTQADLVISAISGIAGLRPTLAALQHNRNLAIANKETLICAGKLIQSLPRLNLIPIDSEHHAITQLYNSEVVNITLTASGGPFFPIKPRRITRAEALKHPIWKMGPKNSVDSATLMNKVLEVFEAEVLFKIHKSQIKIVIHPQSIIHGMVAYRDGNNVAVLYNPDMGIPIANALHWPHRKPYNNTLDLTKVNTLTFFPANSSSHEALELLESDQHLVINAANEVAVDLFLKGAIAFDDIVPLVKATLKRHSYSHSEDLEEMLEYDKQARITAMELAVADRELCKSYL